MRDTDSLLAAVLACTATLTSTSTAQIGTDAVHQLGGFVNALWLEPLPILGGGPDAYSVWTAEDGGRIRRYDSWVGQLVPETVITDGPETLHDVYLHSYPQPGGEAIFGVAVGTRGEAVFWDSMGHASWQGFSTEPAPGEELWACAVEHDPSGTVIWVAGSSETLLCSTDRGSNWNVATFTTPPTAGSTFTSLDFADFALPGRPAVVGNDKGELFRSTDGMTWHLATVNGLPNPPSPLIFWDIDWRTGSTTEAIAVGGRFEGNGEGFAWRTVDGGQTWDRVLTHFEATGLARPPDTAAKPGDPCTGVPGLVRGTNTHVHYATLYGVHMFECGEAILVGYAGQVWKYLPSTGTTFDKLDSFEFTTGPMWGCHGNGVDQVRVSGQFGVIRRSGDRGETWDAVTQNTTWRLHDLVNPTPSVGYVVGQSFRIAKTTDGGQTWVEQRAYHSGANLGPGLTSIDAYDADSVVALGDKIHGSHPAILFTQNGGASCGWREVDLTTMIGGSASFLLREVASSGVDPGTSLPEYWICGRARNNWTGLLRSADGGQTWTAVQGGPDPDLDAFGIDFLSRDLAMVVGKSKSTGAGRAYLTLDATSATPSWIDVKPTFAVGRLTAVDVTGAAAYAVGDGGVVLKYDPGTGVFGYATGMFDPMVQKTTEDLYDVEIRSDGVLVWVYLSGARGVMFREAVGSDVWESVHSRTTDDLFGFDLLSPSGGGTLQAWLTGRNARWGDSTILTLR